MDYNGHLFHHSQRISVTSVTWTWQYLTNSCQCSTKDRPLPIFGQISINVDYNEHPPWSEQYVDNTAHSQSLPQALCMSEVRNTMSYLCIDRCSKCGHALLATPNPQLHVAIQSVACHQNFSHSQSPSILNSCCKMTR